MNPDIFISYAREDASVVSTLAVRLSGHYVVWWDADLIGGEAFEKRILEAIPASRALICVVSRSSSQSVWVKKEVDAAIASGIPVIPVAIDDGELPPHFADKNVLFLDRAALESGGDGFARLMRDLAAYAAVAKPSEASELNPTRIRRRFGLAKLLALLAAVAAVGWPAVLVGVPVFLEMQEEDKQARAEAVELDRKAELGLVLTQAQADWMNGTLGECDTIKIISPAFGKRTGETGKTYSEFVQTGSGTLANTPQLSAYCQSEFQTTGAATDVCVRSIRYARNHKPLHIPFALESIETQDPNTPTESATEPDPRLDVCAMALKAESSLNANFFSDEPSPLIPEVRKVAACLRDTPYSADGLEAQSQGTFRSIEDRLLDAGCIGSDLPADAVGLGAAIPMVVTEAALAEEQRDSILRPLAEEKDFERAAAKVKAYDLERKNAAGVMRAFSDDPRLKRIGYRLLFDAAAAGHIEARANMGLCQLLGIGTPADPAAGSRNISAAVRAGLDLEKATWAWRDSLSGFKVGNVPLLTKTLELRAASGDPVSKAYQGVLSSRGVGACQPRCLETARRLAAELKSAGHSSWAAIVESAVAATESKTANALAAQPIHVANTARSAKWTAPARAVKPSFIERVWLKIAKVVKRVR